MTTLDDDRRDIAVMGSESAWELNRLAHRNHGSDPLPISGDAITRQTKNVAVATHANECDRHNQCQIITHQEDEMYPNSTSETDQAEAIAEFQKFKDPNYKPARHLSWCIPSQCTCHLGPDVCHVGQKVTLERTNFDGDWYSISATPMQLEERGLGYTSVKYVLLNFSGQETSDAAINIDVSEIEEVADWFCSLAEKLKAQDDKPGLNL